MADLINEFTDQQRGYCSGTCAQRISHKLDKNKCREKCYNSNKCMSFEYDTAGNTWGKDFCRIYNYNSDNTKCTHSDIARSKSYTYPNKDDPPIIMGKDVLCEKKNNFPLFNFDEAKRIEKSIQNQTNFSNNNIKTLQTKLKDLLTKLDGTKSDLETADEQIKKELSALEKADKQIKKELSDNLGKTKSDLEKADKQIKSVQTKLNNQRSSYNDTPIKTKLKDLLNILGVTKSDLENADKQILTKIAILQNKPIIPSKDYPAEAVNSSMIDEFKNYDNFSNPSTAATIAGTTIATTAATKAATTIAATAASSTLSSGAKLKTHYNNIQEYNEIFNSSLNTNKNNYLRIFWINNIKKHYDDNTEDSENLYKTKMNMNKIADTHTHLIEVKKQELKELENSNNTNKRKIEININDKMFKNYRSTKLKYIFLAVFILTLFPLLANFDIIPKMTILILWLVVVFVLFIYIYFVFYVQERNRDDSNFNERNFIKPSDHEIARSKLMLEIDEKDKEKCAALSELGDIVDPSNFIVDENIMKKYYTKTNAVTQSCKI